jgi:hypothetical protein
MGVLRFYFIENSINLIGTCLKILQCPTYVHNKTGTLLLVTPPIAMLLLRCLFLPHHDAGSHLLQAPSPQRCPIQAQRPHLEVLGNVTYAYFGQILVGGRVIV